MYIYIYISTHIHIYIYIFTYIYVYRSTPTMGVGQQTTVAKNRHAIEHFLRRDTHSQYAGQ